jgi:ATP-binding cassette subfamily F protein 3
MSKEILKNAVRSFEGTVIIVSHDRDFLHDLTTKTFEFTKDGIKEHIGDINDFLEKKQLEDMRMLAKKDEVKKVEAKNQKPEVKTVDNNREKELKKIKAEIEKSEQKIADLETKIAETDKKLADQSKFHELTKDPSFFANYESLKKQLEAEMANWEKLSGQL